MEYIRNKISLNALLKQTFNKQLNFKLHQKMILDYYASLLPISLINSAYGVFGLATDSKVA